MVSSILAHPSDEDLYDYFAAKPARTLSDQERENIARHVALCAGCTAEGAIIRECDKELDEVLSRPPTLEERADTERTIARLRKSLGWSD